MLNRKQFYDLLMFSTKRENNLFNRDCFPIDLIREISDFHDPEADTLVQLIADGNKDAAKKMLEANPRLVLQAANVTTMGGLTLKRVTPYECALIGDPDMALMVGEYFEKIELKDNSIKKEDFVNECKKLREEQFKRYEAAIDNMLNVKPYDIKALIDIIKRSSKADITEELATDTTANKYNPDYKSELRTALEAFRKAFAPRELKTPEAQIKYIGFIYATLFQVFELLNKEWDALSHNGADYYKNRLVWRQLLFPERRLPAVDRQAFAQDVDTIKNLHEMKRSFHYEHDSQNEFPRTLVDDSRAGLGFDFAISIYGRARGRGARGRTGFQKLCRAKASGFSEVKQQLQHSTAQHEVNRDTHKSHSCMIV
ncbi:MAG: hypothetical protein A3F14_03840 [Gammaproteobacteria bacterium RIFCSPHIGHO2_12_FULL_43_28]|nr:MAG: hypothetical protein A3F14_03840 [Gammaproteobacteria bacterium RIFCSPHIGHO2_12_FULL_43_28]